MRSDPLILNKKGNLKYPRACQGRKKNRWRLVVTDLDGNNRGKKFRRYRKAKQAVTGMREKHPDFEYTIVSLQVGFGPPSSKVNDDQLLAMNHRGRYWCPYCRKFRQFDWDPFRSKDKCPICRIPLDDWHVMRNNPLLTNMMWSNE